jgi:hypothetical protein
MMQLYLRSGEISLHHVQSFQPQLFFEKLVAHDRLNSRILWPTDTAVNSQYASTTDICLVPWSDPNAQGTPLVLRTFSVRALYDWGEFDVGTHYVA